MSTIGSSSVEAFFGSFVREMTSLFNQHQVTTDLLEHMVFLFQFKRKYLEVMGENCRPLMNNRRIRNPTNQYVIDCLDMQVNHGHVLDAVWENICERHRIILKSRAEDNHIIID